MLPPSDTTLPWEAKLGREASAFQASPLWNLTPWRRVNRQVSASICSQPVVALVGTIRRSSPDCQVSGSCRLARVTEAFREAPMLRKELRLTGSSGTTRVMESRAETTPEGSGVAVGAGVGVASGIGVAVACTAAGAVVGAAGTGVAAAPPQATSSNANKAAMAAGQVLRWNIPRIESPPVEIENRDATAKDYALTEV